MSIKLATKRPDAYIILKTKLIASANKTTTHLRRYISIKNKRRYILTIFVLLLILQITRSMFKIEPLTCECKLLKASEYEKKLSKHFYSELNNIDSFENKTTEDILLSRHPNIPIDLFKLKLTQYCKYFPNLLHINWNSDIWQEFNMPESGRMLLYSATYDDRTIYPDYDSPKVRILSLTSEDPQYSPQLYCKFWETPEKVAEVSPITESVLVDWQKRHAAPLMTYILSCNIPRNVSALAVSVDNNSCRNVTNVLKINSFNDGSKKEDFVKRKDSFDVAVCGPALYYYNEDFSVRLIEWIEIMKLLGVSKIILYKADVHKNILKVLKHYEESEFVDLIDFQYPSPYINSPYLRRYWTKFKRKEMFAMENIYFSDCILRYKNRYRFLAHFDPDEVPILNASSLPKALKEIYSTLSTKPAAVKLSWKVFFNDLDSGPSVSEVPNYLHVIRHNQYVLHDDDPKHNNSKSIYDTNQVLGVYSHDALTCIQGACPDSYEIPQNLGYLGHFTKICKDDMCADSNTTIIEEKALNKYKYTLSKNVKNILVKLHLKIPL